MLKKHIQSAHAQHIPRPKRLSSGHTNSDWNYCRKCIPQNSHQ